MTKTERVENMDHMFSLLKEIDIIKQRFQPHDTGHLRGAVRVLELCPVGSSVMLKTQKDAQGKYGRILGEIFVPGIIQSVNQLLVEEGHAVEYLGGKR